MGMAVTIRSYGLLKEVIIDGVCYAITTLDEPKEASVPTSMTVPVTSAKWAEIVDEVLTMPVVKKKKTLGVHLSKILRCISSKEFQNLMREKEDAKHKIKEEMGDHKWMRQAKAEEKWQQQAKREKWELTKVEKAKVVTIKALAALRLKRNIKWPRRLELESESESSEEDMSMYSSSKELSKTPDEYEGSSANCYKCWKVFQGEEKTRAVGCNTPYCRWWFHPECMDVDFSGKMPEEIANTEFICKYSEVSITKIYGSMLNLFIFIVDKLK